MLLRRVGGAALLFSGLVFFWSAASAPAQSAKEKELIALHGQASKLKKEGKLAEALAVFEKATVLAEELFGRSDPNLAAFYGQQAELQQKLGNRPKAEALYLHCLKLTEKDKDADVVFVRNVLTLRLAQLYQRHQEAAKAEPLLRRVLQEGKGHPEVEPMAKGVLAQLLFAQKRYDQAEPFFVQAIAGLETQSDPAGFAVGLQAELGNLYWHTGRGERAEAHLKDALKKLRRPNATGEALLTAGLINVYRGTNQFAKGRELAERYPFPAIAKPSDATAFLALTIQFSLLFKDLGDYAHTEAQLRKALELMEKQYGPKHRSVVDALVMLASFQSDQHEFGRAEASLARAAEIVEGAEGGASPRLAMPLFGLARMQLVRGDLPQAERTFQRCVKVLEAAPDPQTKSMLALLRANLAAAYLGGGRLDEAEKLYAEAIQQIEAAQGADSVDLGRLLVMQSLLYLQKGERGKAQPLLERSLKILEAKLGPDHLYTAEVLSLLTRCHLQAKQYALARRYLIRSARINETRLGPDNLRVAYDLRDQAQLHQVNGDLADALPLLEQARKIFEKKLGADSPQLADLLTDLAKLQVRQQAYGQAAQSMQEARRIDARHIQRVLPALAEGEQLSFLDGANRDHYQAALSLALLRPQDQALVEQSATWVLNGKGVAWQALTERLHWARRSQDSKLGAAVQQWMALRNEFSALKMSAPKPGGEEARGDRLRELWQKQEELGRQIGLQKEAGDDPWIDLAKVRSALPGDSVLIEIARVEVVDFEQDAEPQPRYAAWIIPADKQGVVRLVDLGSARPIEAAVQDFRAAMAAAPRTIAQKGERASEAELRPHLEAISRRVLAPLLDHIGGKSRWLISPDGDLWLRAWSALLLADGGYAIERHTIDYLISGRDLATSRPAASTAPALVVANPDYDRPPAKVSKVPSVASSGALQRVSSNWGRLAGTAQEAKAISKPLEKLAGKVVIREDQDATEEALKAANAPSILVLSTHGYFLEPASRPRPRSLVAERGFDILDQPQPREPGGGEPLLTDQKTGEVFRLGDFMLKLEHPLMACGLVLAGANQRVQRDGGDDGILTGLEIASLDLRGTRLAVLSACETGTGRVEPVRGGVAGLRQAFQLAGARSVAATLWKIPDQETALLMQSFFQNLADGQQGGDALRKAQLAAIARHRQEHQAAHPFYWAAFTLTGLDRD